MANVIELKVWPRFYEALGPYGKNFEMREKRDRVFRVGDILLLHEYDPATGLYTGRRRRARINYVLDEQPFVPEGYVALGLSFGDTPKRLGITFKEGGFCQYEVIESSLGEQFFHFVTVEGMDGLVATDSIKALTLEDIPTC